MGKILFKIITIIPEKKKHKLPNEKCTCTSSSQIGMCKYCSDCYSIIYKKEN